MRPRTLDHVALWVGDRDRVAHVLTSRVGMHVIERTDTFTLVGADARRFKLTLFEATAPRERGALKHVALRVSHLPDGDARVEAGEGLVVRLVEAATDVEYDVDHVALYSADPEATAIQYRTLGFQDAGPARVDVGGAYVEFHAGDPMDGGRPLLNHLAVLVDSAEEHRAKAARLGLEVAEFVDAPNTVAVFVWGPERVKIEYVEHKPTFSLA